MLLSETELRSALEPILNRVLAERLRYFQLQFEPRLQSLLTATLHQTGGLLPNASLQRLLATTRPQQAFQVFYDLARELAGPPLALLVLHRGRAATWKAEGIHATPLAPSLLGDDRVAVAVRGTVVGLLLWESSVDEAARQSLHALAGMLGLVLLAQALPAQPASIPAPAVAATPPLPEKGPRPLPGAAPADAFAHLLIEDLEIYLEHECPNDLRAARQAGEVGRRFAAELERCRAAFYRRHPESPAPLEAAIARLLGV